MVCVAHDFWMTTGKNWMFSDYVIKSQTHNYDENNCYRLQNLKKKYFNRPKKFLFEINRDFANNFQHFGLKCSNPNPAGF